MPDRTLRAGVIGCGLGAYHGYAYSRAPEYELVAVCDLKPDVLDRFCERARVPRGSVREYTDYREMLDKERLDVVSVATPDDHHAGPVCDAADAGVQGIFCEKPLAITLRDADRMIETVERNGAKVLVDHTRSWLPLYQAVREAVRAGEIGGLARIVAHMGGRRAMLFRNGTHLIDAVCYFADAEPLWVIAAHERGFEDYGTEYRGQGGRDPMLDPASTLLIEFANGVRAIVNSAKATPAGIELDLQGPAGRYRLNDTRCEAWKAKEPGGTAAEAPAPQGASYGDYFGDSLIAPVQELARMIAANAPGSSPPRRARNVLEIMLGALLSQSRDSAKVHLPLPRD